MKVEKVLRATLHTTCSECKSELEGLLELPVAVDFPDMAPDFARFLTSVQLVKRDDKGLIIALEKYEA